MKADLKANWGIEYVVVTTLVITSKGGGDTFYLPLQCTEAV